LIGDGEQAATYTVRLFFMSSDQGDVQSQPFDVRLQDNRVTENLNVSAEADVVHRTLMKEFSGIRVKDALKIDLIPRTQSTGSAPLSQLCAIEVLRTGASEIRDAGD
jgi:hypothetical protein